MRVFLKQCRPAILCLLMLTLLCGVVYTGLITGLGQLLFPRQANGSIIAVTLPAGARNEYGSALIAQSFTEPQYLIGRPLTVSNLSPTSGEQAKLVRQRVDWWHSLDPGNTAPIPADLVTGSGSGVDPHISPQAAEYQVARIAKARQMPEEEVRKIIKKHTQGRLLGFIGEPTVNVLQVNLALDGLI